MIYVATKSPRRIELLKKFNIKCKLLEPCMERALNLKDISLFAKQKALSKIECLNNKNLVVSFDTIVVYKDIIFEKPKDKKEAILMLEKLSENWHKAVSTFVIKSESNVKIYTQTTYIKFKHLNPDDIQFLIENDYPLDKAGAYAIQGFAACFIEKIVGNYYNVVGLPISKFISALRNDFSLTLNEIFESGL